MVRAEQFYLRLPRDAFVRVPDQILKTAVFLGLATDKGREYGGTGYIVSVTYGPGYTFTVKTEGISSTSRYPPQVAGAYDFFADKHGHGNRYNVEF
jgi:hypothetical protein